MTEMDTLEVDVTQSHAERLGEIRDEMPDADDRLAEVLMNAIDQTYMTEVVKGGGE